MDRDRFWHRKAVGGRWNKMGRLQFNFLVSRGLTPDSKLLDVGCGSLRAGVLFIDYLNKSNYCGVEKEVSLIKAATEIEIPDRGLADKCPNILNIDNFDLTGINMSFDYALAQSVFTHITLDEIETCIGMVMPLMEDHGVFFATAHIADKISVGKPHVWRKNERSVTKYPLRVFEEISHKLNIQIEYIGDWNHPRGQKMLSFYK